MRRGVGGDWVFEYGTGTTHQDAPDARAGILVEKHRADAGCALVPSRALPVGHVHHVLEVYERLEGDDDEDGGESWREEVRVLLVGSADVRANRGRGPQRRGGGEAEDGVAGLVYRARAEEADAGDDLRGDTRGIIVERAADEGCPFAVDGGLRGHRDAEQGPARLGEEARAEGDEHVRPEPRAAHGGGREGFARKEVPYDIAKFSLCSYGAPEERRDAHLDAEGAGRLAEDLAHEDIAAAPVGAVGPARVGHRIVRLRAFVGGCPLKNLAFSWPGSPREKRVCIAVVASHPSGASSAASPWRPR